MGRHQHRAGHHKGSCPFHSLGSWLTRCPGFLACLLASSDEPSSGRVGLGYGAKSSVPMFQVSVEPGASPGFLQMLSDTASQGSREGAGLHSGWSPGLFIGAWRLHSRSHPIGTVVATSLGASTLARELEGSAWRASHLTIFTR